ncbi:Reverse transcriptase (RNA-dependent DNA polymerase) [Nesidiocoris tenuis]|uniref:Reverse transcriptase (RNA-dependent DNA polymerase) n=1 Tax=Nesidiocoris tenuis TaxID=355587 RepID=A0ABN7BDB1_9HEMI|nr:Reverse transcriptase (RNA-dependent DNA polymerase) [Nesidiocoris tenuis]
MGFSARFTNVIKSLYDKAHFSIKSGSQYTKSFDISEGILQGDVLSPVLFSLFVADFESFLRGRGVTGAQLDRGDDVPCLFYADDLVLLNESASGMRKVLGCLDEYCAINKLQVNSEKSKMVIFRKGGKTQDYKFRCAGKELELVSQFKYLGVVFSCSGKFSQQADAALKNGMAAASNVYPLINQAQSSSPKVWKTLFHALSSATALYGSEVWGIFYCEMIDKLQTRFFKTLLHLPRNTPDAYVRAELGLVSLKLTILKRALSWLAKVRAMDVSRFPSRCLARMEELGRSNPSTLSTDWFSQLGKLAMEFKFESALSFAVPKKDLGKAFESIKSQLLEQDAATVAISRFNDRFNYLLVPGSERSFLYSGMSLPLKRLISRIRVMGKKKTSLTFDKVRVYFDGDAPCSMCNTPDANDSFSHFFEACPIFRIDRKRFFGEYVLGLEQALYWYGVVSDKEARKVAGFVNTAVKQRALIENEGFLF